MAEGRTTQASGQPARQLAQRLQAKLRLLLQLLEQQQIAGRQRIALARRQGQATTFLSIGATAGLPAQVPGLAHRPTSQHGMAQGLGTLSQGHGFALQTQPTVQRHRQSIDRQSHWQNPIVINLYNYGMASIDEPQNL